LAVGLLVAETANKIDPLAEVNGEQITAAEVDKALGMRLAELQQEIFDLKRQKLEALIQERLLAHEAARRGLAVEALLEEEVNAKKEPVTDEEITATYEANKARLKGEEAELRERIRAHLENQKRAARRQAFLDSLRADANVVVHLNRPIYRFEVSAEGAPVRGPETAPVTIVKFEDFHCPYCKRVQPTLADLRARYGEKIRIAHRDFPIPGLHPQVWKAHEAARCAGEQAKFWEYHDLLYAKPPKTNPEHLLELARELGLDLAAFQPCLASDKQQAAVEKDVEQAQVLGLSGTPAFFINGRLIGGAYPLETFVAMIEEELAEPKE
jgi:protein-disulfide isomerase